MSVEQVEATAARGGVAVEVLQGLTAQPKSLSPWLFYDERGSALFERITELPEYYLTRTERGILAEYAGDMVREAGDGRALTVVELGAGTGAKTGLVLQAAAQQQGTVDYYAVDVSATALGEAERRLGSMDGIRVHTRVGDYTDGLGRIEAEGRRLVLYIGSSLGNFEPHAAAALLGSVRQQLAAGDRLLLGVDLVKDAETLLAAYDDAQGVTAEFNKNVLVRLNSELGADFALDAWSHQAFWNVGESRMEMHLRSERAQTATIPSLDLIVRFAEGETIHTENSYKFSGDGVWALLAEAGFALRHEWTDAQRWFGVYLAEAV